MDQACSTFDNYDDIKTNEDTIIGPFMNNCFVNKMKETSSQDKFNSLMNCFNNNKKISEYHKNSNSDCSKLFDIDSQTGEIIKTQEQQTKLDRTFKSRVTQVSELADIKIPLQSP